MTGKFSDNTETSRFEYHVGDLYAYADYRREGNKLFIDKVEAPDKLRGTGAASTLMQHIVNFSKEQNLMLIPVCSYAQAWLRRQNQSRSPKP